ncbi:uncharacterized protein LOC141679170 [Apium graveolens]|uniref:uncharacterized protein LOC141679170 n=1 Tax=Apium graveolens TaxID=4045 RepID=UPI003D7A0BE4
MKIKKVVLDHTPRNCKFIAPNIQKDIINALKIKTSNLILKDLGDDLLGVLVDESRYISIKEQTILLIRYVDKYGSIVEHFLGVVHVNDTTSLSLNHGVQELLNKVASERKHIIDIVDMSQKYVDPHKKLRMMEELINDHHYRVDKFITILDRQVRELDDRSEEIGTELLLNMSSLDPKKSLKAFDQEKLVRFAKFYPTKFFEVNLMGLEWSPYTYFEDVNHEG